MTMPPGIALMADPDTTPPPPTSASMRCTSSIGRERVFSDSGRRDDSQRLAPPGSVWSRYRMESCDRRTYSASLTRFPETQTMVASDDSRTRLISESLVGGWAISEPLAQPVRVGTKRTRRRQWQQQRIREGRCVPVRFAPLGRLAHPLSNARSLPAVRPTARPTRPPPPW